jgi:ABC-type multidrug transport system fused ATPase/permease subunit
MQDVFLFDDTVRENIRLARPHASDEDLVAAAKAANLHEVIAALPGGYDTRVGERAVRLSGGEKQRLSVARALLKDAPILLLDEATSSVDAESEALIQQAIARLARGRTVLVIAHRLSTIRSADRIVVLEHGSVVESGRHDDLVARGGRYASVFAAQRRTREWQIAG